MPKQVLVTGASGTLCRVLVPLLATTGYRVRAMSRKASHLGRGEGGAEWVVADLRSRTGLDDAATGVDVVVHCATAPRGDEAAARNLLAALENARTTPHLVYISIVGSDQIPLGYYRAKLAAERLIAEAGVPHTILRSTQFHDLVLRLFRAQRRLPVLMVPSRTCFQPIDVTEVAARLTALAGAAPAGRVPDLGGPKVEDAGALARSYLRISERRATIRAVHVPGRIGAGYRSGANLAPDHAGGRITFEQFLARKSRLQPDG